MEACPVPLTPPSVSAVPRRMRLLCALVAAVVVGVAVVVGADAEVVLDRRGRVPAPTTRSRSSASGWRSAPAILALGRSRVDADAEGVRVRNIVVRHELPWTAVRAVAFARTSAWATLQLENDDEVALLAVQAVDKERAVRAVEAPAGPARGQARAGPGAAPAAATTTDPRE